MTVDTNTQTLILIGVAVLILIGLVAWAVSRWRHSRELQEKFGPEYDYAIDRTGDRRKAEAELEEREKRVEAMEIHALPAEARARFLDAWQETQAAFVDEPGEAVREANQLIKEVMSARGFPIAEFEQRAADISVVYPQVVTNYRAAHKIAEKHERGGASTEELRQAMVHYRSLFEELLETEEIEPKERT
jgi:hypothetical protein